MLLSPICIIPVILQAACVLTSLAESARSGLCPKGATHRVVQHADVLSRNSNCLGYISAAFILTADIYLLGTIRMKRGGNNRSLSLFFFISIRLMMLKSDAIVIMRGRE